MYARFARACHPFFSSYLSPIQVLYSNLQACTSRSRHHRPLAFPTSAFPPRAQSVRTLLRCAKHTAHVCTGQSTEAPPQLSTPVPFQTSPISRGPFCDPDRTHWYARIPNLRSMAGHSLAHFRVLSPMARCHQVLRPWRFSTHPAISRLRPASFPRSLSGIDRRCRCWAESWTFISTYIAHLPRDRQRACPNLVWRLAATLQDGLGLDMATRAPLDLDRSGGKYCRSVSIASTVGLAVALHSLRTRGEHDACLPFFSSACAHPVPLLL